MVVQKLKDLKKSSKLTNQQLADLSGIPLSTIARIMSGDTPNPQFQTIADLVKALGGSLDEFWDIPPKIIPAEQVEAPTSELINLYREMLEDKSQQLKEKDIEIKEKDEALKVRRTEIKKLLFLLGFTFAAIIAVLLFDLFNGSMGYFRY